jgi:hypothetical protein
MRMRILITNVNVGFVFSHLNIVNLVTHFHIGYLIKQVIQVTETSLIEEAASIYALRRVHTIVPSTGNLGKFHVL